MKIIATAFPLYGDGSSGDVCAEATGIYTGVAGLRYVLAELGIQLEDRLAQDRQQFRPEGEPVTYDISVTVND